MVVDVDTEPTFTPSRARELFTGSYDVSGSANYEVSPDGQSFAIVEGGTAGGIAGELHVIVNWSDELERLVPKDN